jgi:AcrR family transcriptional regulator
VQEGQDAHATPVDGRTLRSLRTREAIVDATISLLEDGDLRPTAPRVADRAGVSVRSVFQHFDELERLHAAVAERLVDRVAVLLVPVPAELPLLARIDRFVAQRTALLEAVTPIRRAANVHGPFSDEITARLRDGQAFLRTELELTFAPELDAFAAAERPFVLDGLDLALGWATWDALRADLARPKADAEQSVRWLVERVLSPVR